MTRKESRHKKKARERGKLTSHAAVSFRDTERQHINTSRLAIWRSASGQASATPVGYRDFLGIFAHAAPLLALIFAIAWFAFCLHR